MTAINTSLQPSEIVLALSGGLDSVVLAHHFFDAGRSLRAVHIDVGMDSSDRERQAAKGCATRLGLQLDHIEFPGWRALSALKRGHSLPYRPSGSYAILSLVTYYARAIGCRSIALGTNAENIIARPYWPEFLAHWVRMVPLIDSSVDEQAPSFDIQTPFAKLTKREVVERGRELSVDFTKTWSCFRGGARPCGECRSCQEREIAFLDANHD